MMHCLSLLLLSVLPYLCYNLQISAPPIHQIIPLGSPLSFSCTIRQTSDLTHPYTLQWVFNGSLLDLVPPLGTARRASSLDALTSTLSITETVWSDSGLIYIIKLDCCLYVCLDCINKYIIIIIIIIPQAYTPVSCQLAMGAL